MSSTQDPPASPEERGAAKEATQADKQDVSISPAIASEPAENENHSADVKKEDDDGDSMNIDAVNDATFEKSDSEAPTIVLSHKGDRDGQLQENFERPTPSPESKEARVKGERQSPTKPVDTLKTHKSPEKDSNGRRREEKTSRARSFTPMTASKELDVDRPSKKRKTPDDDDDRTERRVRSAGSKSRRERSADDRSRDRKESKKPLNHQRRTQPASSHERSTSPPIRAHRRTASATNSSVASGSHPKRRANIPPPLRPTRDTSYSEDSSDSDALSSNGRTFLKTKRVSSGTTAVVSPAKIPHRRNRDQNGRTQLARACASGDVNKVKTQLADRPEDLDEVDYAGTLPIHEASLKGFAPVVRILLDARCAFDRANGDGDTPLIDAVENGHLEVVRLLLEAGADPRKRNKAGEEPYDLVDLDDDNYDAIREELRIAKKRFATRRTSEDEGGRGSIGPESGRSSRDVSTFSPRHSPPAGARSPPLSLLTSSRRRTGRHESTRNDMLWFEASKVTPDHLRAAAAKGDHQMVVSIIQSGLHADVDSMTAAAKAGHVDIINLLLAIGQADADPDPQRRDVKISKKASDAVPFKPGHNTPMLAAIGRGNLEVIKLLLAQSGFDARRRAYKGKTYYELAEERQGVNWEKEVELLKTAFDEQEKQGPQRASKNDKRELSPSSKRISKAEKLSNSEKKKLMLKERDPSSLKERGRDRELKKERSKTSRSSPPRSVSGHDRREDDTSDKDEVKKKRKLVSGKDIRYDREKEKDRRVTSDPISSLKKRRSPRPESPSRQKSSENKKSKPDKYDQDVDMFDVPLETQKLHHESEKKTSRKEGSIKRIRHSSSPRRSESPEGHSRSHSRDPAKKKKRRLESDEAKSSRDNRPTLVKSSLKMNSNQTGDGEQRDENSKKDRLSEKMERASDDRSRDGERHRDNPSESKILKKSGAPDEERPKKLDKVSKDSSKADELKPKKIRPPEKTEAEKEAEEQAKAAKLAAEKEKQRLEEENRKAEAERQRIEAEKQQKLLEEQLEAERQEKIRREEAEKAERAEKARIAEQKARAEAEARRKRELERQRQEEELRERKRLEQEAERQRELQRIEEQRLTALPQALREAARRNINSAEDVKHYLPIFWASLYPSFHYPIGASPRPKENYMTNIQAAMILGIRDLQLSQYTSWDRRPLSDHERTRIWSVMRNMLSGRPDISVPMPVVAEHVEKQKRKFMAMTDLFWIRLSDFEQIIHLHPHLSRGDLKFIEIDMADGTRHGFFSALPISNNISSTPNHQPPATNGDHSASTSPHLNSTTTNGATTNGAFTMSHV